MRQPGHGHDADAPNERSRQTRRAIAAGNRQAEGDAVCRSQALERPCMRAGC
jgi:hypothetical protein